MRSVHKFTFDTRFDQPPPAPQERAAQPEQPAPRYTEAELSAARDNAFAAGKAAGSAEARAGIEAAAAGALETIAGLLPRLLEAQAEGGRCAVRTAVEAAFAMTRKLHPELARRHGLIEVEAVLSQCLQGLRDEPRLVVRVEDSLLDPLSARIDALARSRGFEGRIAVLVDPTLAPGDCRIEWADGGAERLSAALLEEIEAAVGRALADLPAGAPEQGDGAGPAAPRPDAGEHGERDEGPADQRSEQA